MSFTVVSTSTNSCCQPNTVAKPALTPSASIDSTYVIPPKAPCNSLGISRITDQAGMPFTR